MDPEGANTHAVAAVGLASVIEHSVDGGRIVVATATADDWEERVTPSG